MLENKQVDALVASRFALLAKQSIISKNREIVLEGLKKEILSLQEFALSEVCSKGCEFFGIAGTKPSDFPERIVYLSEDDFILIGIRFSGLDVNRPFVSVIPSFETLSSSLIDKISRKVEQEFSVFKPQSFQMTLSPKVDVTKYSVEADRFTVVGVIDDILKKEIKPSPSKIELLAPASIDFYDHYLKEYKIFHKSSPSLKLEVRPESYDDLHEALQDGLLFKIMIDGNFAGVIAGTRRDYHGVSGVSILEEILFDDFRGKGHGKHLQRSFTERIKNNYKVLWGTISQKNEPSLRTALKNGREITEIDYLFKLNSGAKYE
jgi:RimJ/RimL family protein N-acetyltransferase